MLFHIMNVRCLGTLQPERSGGIRSSGDGGHWSDALRHRDGLDKMPVTLPTSNSKCQGQYVHGNLPSYP